MRVKALQDRCVAKERVITRVKKHNANLMKKQEQYKEALHTLHGELKETREKLEESDLQKEKLQGELSTLHGQVEKAGTDAVTEFKMSQPFIDSCAEYYGIGFEDCLKQIMSSVPNLDLSGITMDDLVTSTPTSDTVFGGSDNSTESDLPPKDDSVVLAQPAADPSVTSSNPTIEFVHVENPHAQDKDDEALNDAPAA